MTDALISIICRIIRAAHVVRGWFTKSLAAAPHESPPSKSVPRPGVSREEGTPLFCAAPTRVKPKKGAAASAEAGTGSRPAAVPALIVNAPIGPLGVFIGEHDAADVIAVAQMINVTWTQRRACA